MTIKEAKFKIESLENDLTRLINDKILLETTMKPKSTDTTKVLVDGGKHNNAYEIYVEKQDLPRWKDLDKRIKRTQDKIKNLLDWTDRQLKILKKYNKSEQLIVYYKEIDNKNYTWEQIGNMQGIYLSARQCQRIYRKYRRRRVENGKSRNL